MHIVRRFLKKIIKKEKIPILMPVHDNMFLNGKVVLITGGNSGIGLAIARAAVAAGAKVLIAGRDEKKSIDVCNQIGENSRYFFLDITHLENAERQILDAISLFPENRIDILVNSAGYHCNWDFFNFDETSFNRTFDVNIKGTYFVSQVVAKYFIKNGIKGHILNLSSSSALRPAWTPYQISKWAVNGITKGLSDLLLPYGIIVNGIAPGPTATEMVGMKNADNLFYENQPANRYLMPEEVANLAVFMMSDYGNMIVGDTYYISGGSGVISYHK